jgi:hypothetical protein
MAPRLIRAVYENGPKDRLLAQVLGVLAFYARSDGSECYPGVDHIANFCRVKRRIVIAALRKGERENWVQKIKGTQGDKRRSAYLLNLSRLLSNKSEIGAIGSNFPDNKVQSTTFPEIGAIGAEIGAIGAEKGAKCSTPLKEGYVRDTSRDTPSGKGRSVDCRHIACRDLVHAYHAAKHPGKARAPWDGSEARQLGALLSANPNLSVDDFATLLKHRSDSDVNHSARPRTWLSSLTDYARGPLDRYAKPKGSHGTHSSSTTSGSARGAAVGRVQRTMAAFRKAGLASIEAAGDYAAGADGSGVPEPGVRGGDGPDVPAGDGDAGSRVRSGPRPESDGIVSDSAEILPPPKPNPRGIGSHDGQRAQR